jgi:TolB protein
MPTAAPLLLPGGEVSFESPLDQGLFFLSLGEGGYHHLFAYQPLGLPFTRLTDGPWDDITPALSPDRARLAFASNRDGPWDLYLLELASGAVTRLTDTPEYDAAPSWSPDGLYLAYESYPGNLEILIRPVAGDQPPISLSGHPAADFAPGWSPKGRQLAFVSDRSGEPEIWLADLDQSGEARFTNLSRRPGAAEAHPAWSPDGTALAWASVENGAHNLLIWDGESEPRRAGSGDWPAWSPDGRALASAIQEPLRALLAATTADGSVLALPPVALPGPPAGLEWKDAALPAALPEALARAAQATLAALWEPALQPLPDVPDGRHHLAPLAGVEAPYPQLHDLVDESFQALRRRAAADAGWDLLATLENAFVPLTAPLAPGLGDSWLYTGRAFAFTPLPANAGWLAVAPEDFGAQRYWRVYLRARQQDGSQGMPLHERPWDFNARFSGDPALYEQGGAPLPAGAEGYWIDLTELAAAYGWARLPALHTWRASYPAARFNEFVLSGDQDWRAAMLELYPPEALVTPTAIVPPTLTPTVTPRWRPTAAVTPTPLPPAP